MSIIDNQYFTFEFDMVESEAARLLAITNKLTGCHLDLGPSEELRLWTDSALYRTELSNWRQTTTEFYQHAAPDQDTGMRQGYFKFDYDASEWVTSVFPSGDRINYTWARTNFALPDSQGEPVVIVLGGYGLYDTDWMRVFLNGVEIGTRIEEGCWREPGVFRILPTDERYSALRFGGDNVLAIQLKGVRLERRRLHELNSLDARNRMEIGLCTPAPVLYDQYVTVGEPLAEVGFKVDSHRFENTSNGGELIVNLRAQTKPILAEVRYSWKSESPVLTKSTRIHIGGTDPIDVLDVDLGDYRTGADCSEGEIGFPVYVDYQFFFSVAHPVGLAQGMDGRVRLRQFVGQTISPSESLDLMEVVVGVSPEDGARKAFRDYLLSRCRRTTRGHDTTYAFLLPFGGWDTDEHGYWMDEKFMTQVLDTLEEIHGDQKLTFDACGMAFYIDTAKDFTAFYESGEACRHLIEDYSIKDIEPFLASGWPDGPEAVFERMRKLGTWPMLGVEISHMWEPIRNPLFRDCFTGSADGSITMDNRPLLAKIFCHAAEPFAGTFKDNMLSLVREHNLGALIIDGCHMLCHSGTHGHRPGKYSAAPICDSYIDVLKALDEMNPDVFLMGYWGYNSPWWLLWMDVIYDSGLLIEAGQACNWQTKYMRDGVTRALDQAEWYAVHCGEIPALCKDSLGIWLSPTSWNSRIGKERWREGFVMDMCRGSLLAQIWTFPGWLDQEERDDLANFISLLRSYPECFRDSQFILGNPWADNLYGYLCKDGDHAFIALNNGGPSHAVAEIRLDSEWGFRGDCDWRITQAWPRSEHGAGDIVRSHRSALVPLDAWEIILLEITPKES